jgi:hypothetical protein
MKMSLFNALKKLAGAAVKEGLEQYAASRQQAAPASQTAPNAQLVDLYSFRGTPYEYFNRLLHTNFPEYEIRTNVDPRSVLQISGTAWTCRCGNRNYTAKCEQCGAPQPREYQPITFMLYRNNMPALAIILCDKQRAPVRKTMELCKTRGIACQCYYTHFLNAASYVTERIRTDLR